ncbi:MAG: RNA polymerase sigma factor [Planctomycetes bacterium]|nr:RNA polymerase sigma factor [Planctomycetota bacterium]
MDPRGEVPEKYWELIERYRGELVNQALAICGKLEDAEDVVQETLCEAFRDPAKLAQARSLGAFLRSINRANALNRTRDRKRDAAKSGRKQLEAPARLVTTGGFSLLELRDSVAKAIETLPPHLRTVVVLRYWQHLSYEEMAARLNVPSGTVGRLLYEATLALYDKLKIHLETPAAPPAQPNPSAPDASKEPCS